ncbi:hypothetical protein J437_LFUL018126 [Ladona fulva]|uniref:Uncharacterized protein n=1 Tax=Ladona fulva TaxID=123851 RepID=A0A8K0KQ70_LADFU|nr:hypothetical protein J437_LFUL018126 [Ladona fulva]
MAEELSPADYANHRNLCELMLAQIPPEAAFFSSDEAHFHLSGIFFYLRHRIHSNVLPIRSDVELTLFPTSPSVTPSSTITQSSSMHSPPLATPLSDMPSPLPSTNEVKGEADQEAAEENQAAGSREEARQLEGTEKCRNVVFLSSNPAYIAAEDCGLQTKSEVIVSLMEVVLQQCHEAGLRVIATVGANNIKAIRSIGSSISHPFVTFNNQTIFTIFDPPHLLKATRNIFMIHDFILPVQAATLRMTVVSVEYHLTN